MIDETQWLASIAVYWEALSEMNADDLRFAFQAAWREHTEWMPSCGQLFKIARGKGQDPKSLVAEAWTKTLELAKQSRGDHPDPIAKEAINRMGGGKHLGQMSWDDLTVWGRKEFEATYLEILDGHATRQMRELTDGKNG